NSRSTKNARNATLRLGHSTARRRANPQSPFGSPRRNSRRLQPLQLRTRGQGRAGALGRSHPQHHRGRRAQARFDAAAGVVMAGRRRLSRRGASRQLGTPKVDPEALWRRNRALREKALAGKLSPQELGRLPQLWGPIHFKRPKQLRAEDLFQYLLQLSVMWPTDRRFTDCLSALFEHRIVVPKKKKAGRSTHMFSRKPELEFNQHRQGKLLEMVRARMEAGESERQACRQVAAIWVLEPNSFRTAWQGLRDLSQAS